MTSSNDRVNMNSIRELPISNIRILIGALFLIAGFCSLMLISWAWWGLFLGGILAWITVFGKDSKKAFVAPRALWLIPIGAVSYLILGMLTGLLSVQLGFEWSANPASGHLGQLALMIPFMLMGEELLGIGILEAARNKGLSLVSSTLWSALIFAFLHIPSYWDGSFFSTLVHVILLQGVARIIFNFVYIKTGKSIWGSWLTHMLVDFFALLF